MSASVLSGTEVKGPRKSRLRLFHVTDFASKNIFNTDLSMCKVK